MCRTNVAPEAEPALGRLLSDIAVVLAVQLDADPADVVIGPVDFGHPPQE